MYTFHRYVTGMRARARRHASSTYTYYIHMHTHMHTYDRHVPNMRIHVRRRAAMLRKKRNMVCSHVLTHNMHTYTRQARHKHADSPPQEGCYASEKAKHGLFTRTHT